MMAIPDFSLVMWISYLLFFEPAWVVWLERQLRRWLKLAPEASSQPQEKQRCPLAMKNVALTMLLGLLLTVAVWGGVNAKADMGRTVVANQPRFVQAINQYLHLVSP